MSDSLAKTGHTYLKLISAHGGILETTKQAHWQNLELKETSAVRRRAYNGMVIKRSDKRRPAKTNIYKHVTTVLMSSYVRVLYGTTHCRAYYITTMSPARAPKEMCAQWTI